MTGIWGQSQDVSSARSEGEIVQDDEIIEVVRQTVSDLNVLADRLQSFIESYEG